MENGRPTGATAIFPIVGDPVAQVKSPTAISAIFSRRGVDAVCIPMQVAADGLSPLLASLYAVRNAGGVLVTVPHKRASLVCCAFTTERARFAAAVNVLRRTPDGWSGDNSDGAGFLDGIERRGFAVADKSALLVGCGGAGAAIALEILVRGAARLAIHDTDIARRDEIVSKLSARFPGRVAAGSADPAGFDLVANATPMGMNAGDPVPVDASALLPEQFVACVVTKPEIPPLIAVARRLGCRTATGSDMFEAQAEKLADFLLAAPSSCSTGQGKLAENLVS